MEGWESPKFHAYLSEKLPRDNSAVFWSFLDSSFFHKMDPQFDDLDDYVTSDDVIGHDVIGHPDIRADNSDVGQSKFENRLGIAGLQVKWQPD